MKSGAYQSLSLPLGGVELVLTASLKSSIYGLLLAALNYCTLSGTTIEYVCHGICISH